MKFEVWIGNNWKVFLIFKWEINVFCFRLVNILRVLLNDVYFIELNDWFMKLFILDFCGYDKWWINLNELFFFDIKLMGDSLRLVNGDFKNGLVILFNEIFLLINFIVLCLRLFRDLRLW